MTSLYDDVQLIPVREVIRILGISRTTVWNKVKNDSDFPQPCHFGPRCTRFEKGEVIAYARKMLEGKLK